MFETIDFKSGKVMFIDDGDYLKEDLLQVQYKNYILDAGWYNKKIGFKIFIVKDYDFENPISTYQTRIKEDMLYFLRVAIDRIELLENE